MENRTSNAENDANAVLSPSRQSDSGGDNGGQIQTYNVDKRHQLVPINDESTVDFSSFFEVQSVDNAAFEMTIVEQGDLQPKNYRAVEKGYVNGSLKSDGDPKIYFLVLRSNQPCVCKVKVTLEPLGGAKEETGRPEPASYPPSRTSTVQATGGPAVQTSGGGAATNLKYALVALTLAGAAYGAFKYASGQTRKKAPFDMRTPSISVAESYF